MTNDLLARAKLLAGTPSGNPPKQLGTPQSIYSTLAGGLDVYIAFDTTGSMDSTISKVRKNIGTITTALLDGKSDIRLSINGVGDHCDGEYLLQLYHLSKNPAEVRGAIENIVMTHGGDEPEAYECLAVSLAKRIPLESAGRKRAVVLIGDSYPHGMRDAPCVQNVDYKTAFSALKTLCDGFYMVGCEPQHYSLQRQLITAGNDKERFIELGDMNGILCELLVALARKTQSPLSLEQYLKSLGSDKSNTIRGLLGR